MPGSLVVERNVLEWRFDPASDARLPEATGYDVDVIVLCSEGYTSSLAADALRSLGLHRATDVVGGFLRLGAPPGCRPSEGRPPDPRADGAARRRGGAVRRASRLRSGLRPAASRR